MDGALAAAAWDSALSFVLRQRLAHILHFFSLGAYPAPCLFRQHIALDLEGICAVRPLLLTAMMLVI